jgi:hypothetical protein
VSPSSLFNRGFTPVEWESRVWNRKGDDSLQSFLVTLQNPHGVPPRKFALKAEGKQDAIWCYSAFGDCVCVSDNCNANRNSDTHCSYSTYVNNIAF